jgi:hypothetical protein
MALTNCPSASAASLIGDTIQFDYQFPLQGIVLQSQTTAVAAGNSDAISGLGIFTFNPEATGFTVSNFLFSNAWLSAPFNGFRLSSLNFDDSSTITGFTLNTNMIGLDASRIVFTGNTFTLNWQGLAFNRNTFVNVGFITSSSSTPIPTPVLLPGLIGLGLGALRKQKSEKVKAEL